MNKGKKGNAVRAGLIVIVVIVLFWISSAWAEDIVFLSAGQSNAFCCGTSADIPAEYRNIPPNAEYYDNGSRIYDYQVYNSFGPEVSLLNALAAEYPGKKVIFIRHAVSGSSVARWCPERIPSGYSLPYGDIYPEFIDDIKKATGGRSFGYGGIFWTQSEKDTIWFFSSLNYKKRMECFIRHLRKDIGVSIPVFYALAGRTNEFADVVQQWQLDMAKNPGYFPVSALNLPKLGDGVHYDTTGQLELGERYFKVYATHK